MSSCRECGGDIGSRGPQARFCIPCRKQRDHARTMDWNKRNPARKRINIVKAKYGLTPEQYAAMPQECEVCGVAPVVVDHCHTTGRVRGSLCHKCNRAIGALGDTADSVQRAADYLRGKA